MELVAMKVTGWSGFKILDVVLRSQLQHLWAWQGRGPESQRESDIRAEQIPDTARSLVGLAIDTLQFVNPLTMDMTVRVDGEPGRPVYLEAFGACRIRRADVIPTHQFALFSQPVRSNDANFTGDGRHFLFVRTHNPPTLGPWVPAVPAPGLESGMMVRVAPYGKGTPTEQILNDILPNIGNVRLEVR
jgi:hypothetical protein